MENKFRSLWEDKDKWNEFIKMFECVYSFLKGKNLYPVICCGTLLGCRRNGKQIPWDGDIDIVLSKSDFLKVYDEFFSSMNSGGYKFSADGPMNYKVYSAKLAWWSHGSWIDIDFWERKESVKGKEAISVLNHDGTVRHSKCPAQGAQMVMAHGSGAFWSSHDCDDIFPLKKSKFEGIEVYVPNNIDKTLDTWYPNWDKEYKSSMVNFKTITVQPTITIPINP